MPLSEFPLPAADTAGDEPPEIRVPPPGPMSRSARRPARAGGVPRVRPPPGRARRARAAPRCSRSCSRRARGRTSSTSTATATSTSCAGFGALLLGHGATPVIRALEGAGRSGSSQALGDVYSADAKLALLERLASLHPGRAPARPARPERQRRRHGGHQDGAARHRPARRRRLRGRLPRPRLRAPRGLRRPPRRTAPPFADQLNPRVAFAPYPRAEADVDRALAAVERPSRGGDVGAVLVEPILGRGGCVVPPDAFVKGVVEAAHRHGALVIADEIWTGLGRSGAMVRTTAIGAPADILCFGKGLGGGLAISACVAARGRDDGLGRAAARSSTPRRTPAPRSPAPPRIATLDALRFRQPRRPRERGRAPREGGLPRRARRLPGRGRRARRGPDDRRRARRRRPRPPRDPRHARERGYVVLTGGLSGRGAHADPGRSTSPRSASPTPPSPCADASRRGGSRTAGAS